ncbi:conopressin receptor [Elysia marginata]|uniref:Conopressin receptor n=1 Tax=Elysia marginata TaxID=1093978 RepID=A0AAV4GVT2_9GAST|nr:conopressin receptor [Elysia marginata]
MVLTLNLTAKQALSFLPSTPASNGNKITPGPELARHHTRDPRFTSQANNALLLHWTPMSPFSEVLEAESIVTYQDNESAAAAGQSNFSTITPDNVSQSPVVMDFNEGLRKAEIGVLAAILYLALFGNGIVLLVLRLRRQKLSRMQWFIAHLAIADMFVAFFNVLPQLMWDILGTFHGNDFLCKIVAYFQLVAMYASSWVLVMAAVDRYVSICHPLTSQTLTPKRVHVMISLAWTMSLAFSLPQFFIFSYTDPYGDGHTCHASFVEDWGIQAYIVYVFLSDYAIPFVILAFCYGTICHVVSISVGSKESKIVYRSVRKGNTESDSRSFRFRISFHSSTSQRSSGLLESDRMRKGAMSGLNRSGGSSVFGSSGQLVTSPALESKKPRAYQRGVSRSKIKTIKLTLTVVLCYLICWAPYFFVQLYSVFGGEKYLEHPAVVLLMLMASLNSCTNPWIYLAFSGCKCPSRQQTRRVSRSWGLSTHLTSAADSHDRDSRTHSQVSARSSNISVSSAVYHPAPKSNRNIPRSKCGQY